MVYMFYFYNYDKAKDRANIIPCQG